MPIDDLPEISYQELNTPAIELFSPSDNPEEYILAAEADIAAGRWEYYDFSKLDRSYNNVIDAFLLLSLEEMIELNRSINEIHKSWMAQKKEKKRKEMHDYTLEDLIKNPLKNMSFGSVCSEVLEDLDFQSLFSGKIKWLKNDLATLASFGLFSVPHELIHAGVNYVTGGINEKIAINSFYGGALWEKIIPGVQSEFMFPLLGGYVQIENPSAAGNLATYVAPYILTPLGIYLAKKGKEKESIALCAGGAGLISVHLGGVIGDWRNTGTKLIKESVELVQDTLEVKSSGEYGFAANIAFLFGGIYLGSKLLAISYRASKATVNSVRNYAKKK